MKILFISFLVFINLFAGVWSRTEMQIATGKINPFVSKNMSNITKRVENLKEKLYKEQIRKRMAIRNKQEAKKRELDKYILLEIRKIDFIIKQQIGIRK